jgi:intracellular multiplication protein IcmP
MNDSQQNNSGALPLIILGIAFMGLAFYGLWHFKHAAIAKAYMKWRYLEVLPFSLLFDYAEGVKLGLRDAIENSERVPFAALRIAGNQVGVFYVPIVIGLAAYSIRRALATPILKSYRVHDSKSLMEAQARVFPSILPVIDLDLTDDTSARWAVSRRPEEFARDHGLVADGKFNRQRAKIVFLEQLGRWIKHPDQLYHHEKALFSVFAARIIDGREASKALLDGLNRSARNKDSRPNYKLAQQAYTKYRQHPDMLAMLRQHPYSRTFLFALLLKARETGVLASSEFLWLKPNDRMLWYPLNSAGRKTPFVDGAAVFSQYQAERVAADANRELVEPYIERAIDGLATYLKKIGITDEDTNDSYNPT